MKLGFAATAEADLQSAVNWYNKEREGLGNEFLDELVSAMKAIEGDPSDSPELKVFARGGRFDLIA